MANTTLNPSDKESHISLSGGNLTATGTAGWTGLVRAIDAKTTGKFYWEATLNAAAGATGVGVALGTLPVTTTFTGSAVAGHCGLPQNGVVWVNGASTISIDGVGSSSISFGSISSGTVICVALDMAAKKIWFRLGAAGNWNNSAARNPATGVGGADIPAVTTAYPTLCFGGADNIVANFGSSALTGAVPSGYTSGWPDATAPPADPPSSYAGSVAGASRGRMIRRFSKPKREEEEEEEQPPAPSSPTLIIGRQRY